MNDVFFQDRVEAGERLAEKLVKYKDASPVVLALPRGGVILGNIIAKRLHCPLGLLITRKIGHPKTSEYAIAAVTTGGEIVENEAETIQVDRKWFERERKKQQEEARRRQDVYLGGRKTIDLKDKTVIIVDDGIATGLTMMAGIKEIKSKKPAKIVVTVPVIPFDTYETLLKLVNEVVYISAPDDFIGAIGAYYTDFSQVTDEEVIKLLKTS